MRYVDVQFIAAEKITQQRFQGVFTISTGVDQGEIFSFDQCRETRTITALVLFVTK